MFKVGDRVRVVSEYSSGKKLKGHFGTIVDANNGRSVCVEFDEYINGHDGNDIASLGRDGHCWWIDVEELIITSSTLKIPNGKFIVMSNDPQYSKIFIKEAHVNHGLRWSDGYNDELTYHRDGIDTVYYIVEEGIIHYALEPWEFCRVDYALYNIKELFKGDFKQEYKFNKSEDVERVLVNEPAIIVFTKDGYKGVAVCDDKDKFDHEVGYKIAYAKIERARATKKLKEIDKLLKSYL